MKRLSRQILEQMLEESSEGIVVAEASGPDYPVIFANSAYAELSVRDIKELRGGRLPLIDDERLGSADHDKLNTALAEGQAFEASLDSDPDGGQAPGALVRMVPLRSRTGKVTHFMVSHSAQGSPSHEISSVELGVLQREINRARKKLASMDRIDPATGVLRYQFFRELAERDFRIARREGRWVAVMLFEIIDLGVYSETYGQKAAESCVRMVAAQVNSLLRRASDLCAKADEGTIVAMAQAQDADEARARAEQIAANIRGLRLHNPRGRSRYIDVEIGVAGETPDGVFTLEQATELAREDLESRRGAQKALYSARA
ncbi:MAG: diguanylate cyclase domain-containing protein [Gammaproteobacteria bacterium]